MACVTPTDVNEAIATVTVETPTRVFFFQPEGGFEHVFRDIPDFIIYSMVM